MVWRFVDCTEMVQERTFFNSVKKLWVPQSTAFIDDIFNTGPMPKSQLVSYLINISFNLHGIIQGDSVF
jgi:hypothetical protein